MSVTVNVNGLSLCHRRSGGVSMATLPDVCLTPGAGPVPYPNVAFARDLAKGTTTVTADGADMCANFGSEFSRSTGDEPGTGGGVASRVNTREATWITYSFDVSLEGQGACRLTDKMFHNRRNTVNMAGLVQPPLKPPSDPKCAALYQIIYDIIWRIRPSTPPGGRPMGEKELAWRWLEYAEDERGWTPGRRTSGHVGEHRKQQERLKNKLHEWRRCTSTYTRTSRRRRRNPRRSRAEKRPSRLRADSLIVALENRGLPPAALDALLAVLGGVHRAGVPFAVVMLA